MSRDSGISIKWDSVQTAYHHPDPSDYADEMDYFIPSIMTWPLNMNVFWIAVCVLGRRTTKCIIAVMWSCKKGHPSEGSIHQLIRLVVRKQPTLETIHS